MSERRLQSLVYNAVMAIKDGEKNLARNYLDRALYSARDHDVLADIWFYFSEIEDEPAEKRKALEQALSYRMTHARARRALAVVDGRLKADDVINPDAIPAPIAGDSEANADRFMCPNCGARMSFAPDGQSLVCDFCASSGDAIAEEGALSEEQDFFGAMATLRGHSKPVSRQIFHCKGCGAEFILPPDQISASCAYCTSPHVVSLEQTRELLDPDAVIPHAFSQREATKLLVDWVQAHDFTPQGHVLPPRGFYLPVWTFDFAGFISYSGQRYEDEDNPFKQGARNRVKVTERGEYPVYIDDLVLPANHDYRDLVQKLIKTYDFGKSKPYDQRYLSNWAAEAYEIALGDASLEARSRAYKFYQKKLQRDMRKLMNLTTSSANLAIDSYKLLMLPIWLTTYPYAGKEYQVLINGQTRAVQGQLPKEIEKESKKRKKSNGGLLDWLDDIF